MNAVAALTLYLPLAQSGMIPQSEWDSYYAGPDAYYAARLKDTSNPYDLRSFNFQNLPYFDGVTQWQIYNTDGEENIETLDEAVTACNSIMEGGRPIGDVAKSWTVPTQGPNYGLYVGQSCEGRVAFFENIWWTNRQIFQLANGSGVEKQHMFSMGMRQPCTSTTWSACFDDNGNPVVKYDLGMDYAVFENLKGADAKDCEHQGIGGAPDDAYCRAKCNSNKFLNTWWVRSSTHTLGRWVETDVLHKLKLLCAVEWIKPLEGHGHGDPHLKNVKGEDFDVMQEGNMLFLEIPRRSTPETLNFAVHADIERLGGANCGPTYITKLQMTGSWLGDTVNFQSGKLLSTPSKAASEKHAFGIKLGAGQPWYSHVFFLETFLGAESKPHLELPGGAIIKATANPGEPRAFLMKVKGLTVVISQPKRPRVFLDLQLKGLEMLTEEIGGLLGIDDHTDAEALPAECK